MSADARPALSNLDSEDIPTWDAELDEGEKHSNQWLLTIVGTNVSVLGYFMNAGNHQHTCQLFLPSLDGKGTAGRPENDSSREETTRNLIHGCLNYLCRIQRLSSAKSIDGQVHSNVTVTWRWNTRSEMLDEEEEKQKQKEKTRKKLGCGALYTWGRGTLPCYSRHPVS